MSKEIFHHDQCKLYQIFKQVEALSDVVDELRTELNEIKKISLNVNHENVFFESTKENNKVDCVRPSVLQKVKTYVRNIGVFKKSKETYRFAQNTQACKSYSTFPNHGVRCKRKKDRKLSAIKFSTIYGGLKFFKNKLIKNVGSVRKTQQSPKITKHKCVMLDQQQQMYLLQEEGKQEPSKFDTRNKNIDISEELGNSANTSLTSDASTQAEIATCSWQDDEKSSNCNYFSCRNIMVNNMQATPLSMISDDRSTIHSDRFAEELSKNCVKQAFLKNKIKKYKKCSCGEQCPYALYKLPCNKQRCSMLEKKVDDEISRLTLEYFSFGKKNNFPKFINVDTVREKNKCFVDFSPVEIGMNESSSSSLSVNLEVNICNDNCNSENIDEFPKQRKTRTYIVNRMNTRKNNPIKNFRTGNEPSFNIISRRDANEKKERSDEIIENMLSQRKYINSEENHQESYKKSGTEDFTNGHWPIKNNNKQVQCAMPALIIPVSNRKISVKTPIPDFQQSNILNQSYQTTNKTRCTNIPKMITLRRMKTDTQTQGKCFNELENKSSALDDYTNEKSTKKIDEEKKIARIKNTCDSCIIKTDASPSSIIWPRTKRYNIYSTLRTEDVNVHSNESSRQICGSDDCQNRIMRTFYPYYCNYASEKRRNFTTLMSCPIDYHHTSKVRSFDMSNVSGRLYGCLEKLEDITA